MQIIKLFIFTFTLFSMIVFSGCKSNNNSPVNILNPIISETNNSQKENFTLSIIHINDTHSHLDSETYSLSFDGVTTYTEIGGYPRVVSKIKELQDSKINTLTLNAGDTFQGTLYYSLFKGKADSDMLNMITWDAFALGNHEFDDGDEALAIFLNDVSDVPIVSANVIPAVGNILQNRWTPYIIKEYNSEKVGVIGIDTAQKTKISSNPSDEITFLDEIQTAQKYIDELSIKGINKIVILSHQGYENDKEMAAKLTGVDIIIGGDSHTLLGDYSAVGLVNKDGYDYPTHVINSSGEKVCIGQAWQYAYAIGSMEIQFDSKGIVKSCTGDSILLLGDSFLQKDADGDKVEVSYEIKSKILHTIETNSNLAQITKDSVTENILSGYKTQVNTQKNIVIGEAGEFLGHNRIPGDMQDGLSDLALGSDIAPIVAKSFYDLSNRADACIQNAGGVRTAINDGNISVGTAYELLPFSNTLFEIEMYGSEIKQVLEDAMSNYLDNDGSTGSFPYAYALRYDVNSTAKTNYRISNLEIKDRESGIWGKIITNKMYVIVTHSYISSGRDGYTTFATAQELRGNGINTYLDYAMSFVRYVEKLKENEKRVVKLPSSDHPIKSYN